MTSREPVASSPPGIDMWFVYIVRCADESLYTGVCKNIDKRLAEHNCGKRGAKYTKARRPVNLVYRQTFKSRSEAQQKEAKIKKLSKENKEKLLKQSGD